MISFYPGPSTPDKNISKYFKKAHEKGLLSINHRSKAFADLYKETQTALKDRLLIPDDYGIAFVSSATECWEILAQSISGNSCHFYNGSFGEKWFTATTNIKKDVTGYGFELNKKLTITKAPIPDNNQVICLTQNETSNGTQVSNKIIEEIKAHYPDKLIAIDATSSFGGQYLEIANADIWYASVQKCLGLPAGLGLLIYSPRAKDHLEQSQAKKYYNELSSIISNAEKLQTTHTPNIAGIYLLKEVISARSALSKVDNKLAKRAKLFYEFIDERKSVSNLIINTEVRSKTVLAVHCQPDILKKVHKKALERGITLGKGYGNFAQSTFRIANFPAISDKSFDKLFQFLKAF